MASVIQVKTRFGTFEVDRSEYRANDDGDGVTIRLRFVPGPEVDASRIALVQIANSIVDGRPEAINNSIVIRHHSIPAGEPGAGFHIDQDPPNRNPLFIVDAQPPGNDDLSAGIAVAFFGGFGSRQRESDGTEMVQPATLFDLTHLVDAGPRSEQRFETYGLAVEGPQRGTYYGGVSWGWAMDMSGRLEVTPLALVSPDTPSAIFARAAEIWNQSVTSDGAPTIPLPISVPVDRPDGPEETDDFDLDLTTVSPEALLALQALVENLITQQHASPRPPLSSEYFHSSHSSRS
jgi:hypothetical protein